MALAATWPSTAPLPLYRPRQVRNKPLYQLLESYYEDVKALWEERFEKNYGCWRGFIDLVVWRYLDCGVEEAGFARLWFAYGGQLRREGDALHVIPKDGLRQRLHVIRRSQRVHLWLDRDGFARDVPVVLQESLEQIRFTLENRTADAHQTRLVLSGVPEGDYKVVQDGKTIASIVYRGIKEVAVEIPAGGSKTHVLEIVRSS